MLSLANVLISGFIMSKKLKRKCLPGNPSSGPPLPHYFYNDEKIMKLKTSVEYNRPMKKRLTLRSCLLTVLVTMSIIFSFSNHHAYAGQNGNSIVLTNSTSTFFVDFQKYIEPYLKNFGVPYSIVDIADVPLPGNINDYSIIIIGHKGLDETGTLLDSTEQDNITDAVANGTGLLNFDLSSCCGL